MKTRTTKTTKSPTNRDRSLRMIHCRSYDQAGTCCQLEVPSSNFQIKNEPKTKPNPSYEFQNKTKSAIVHHLAGSDDQKPTPNKIPRNQATEQPLRTTRGVRTDTKRGRKGVSRRK